jgi:hypothetical protein
MYILHSDQLSPDWRGFTVYRTADRMNKGSVKRFGVSGKQMRATAGGNGTQTKRLSSAREFDSHG